MHNLNFMIPYILFRLTKPILIIQCVDFTAICTFITYCCAHFMLTSLMVPVALQCGEHAIMAILGEYLCLRAELAILLAFHASFTSCSLVHWGPGGGGGQQLESCFRFL